MKNILKYTTSLLLVTALLVSCSKDDDPSPDPVAEKATMTLHIEAPSATGNKSAKSAKTNGDVVVYWIHFRQNGSPVSNEYFVPAASSGATVQSYSDGGMYIEVSSEGDYELGEVPPNGAYTVIVETRDVANTDKILESGRTNFSGSTSDISVEVELVDGLATSTIKFSASMFTNMYSYTVYAKMNYAPVNMDAYLLGGSTAAMPLDETQRQDPYEAFTLFQNNDGSFYCDASNEAFTDDLMEYQILSELWIEGNIDLDIDIRTLDEGGFPLETQTFSFPGAIQPGHDYIMNINSEWGDSGNLWLEITHIDRVTQTETITIVQ